VQQIFSHLLSKAIKFSDYRTKISIECKISLITNQLTFIVIDKGLVLILMMNASSLSRIQKLNQPKNLMKKAQDLAFMFVDCYAQSLTATYFLINI
jgi:nitrogen-specific signal transduction histidine kinase